jgi:hypothetical protein
MISFHDVDLISLKANQKFGHALWKMQYLIIAFKSWNYMILMEVFKQSLEVKKKKLW